MHIGIGFALHLGDLMLGIIGSEERMLDAVVTDAVNLSARLETLTRVYAASMTITETTLSRLKNPAMYKYRFIFRSK